MNIFYFSGTGNSFYVAREISEKIHPSTLYSIPEVLNKPVFEFVDPEILIVCPLYFYAAPPLVLEFIDRLKANTINYLSFVFTAEYPNGLAIRNIREFCLNRQMRVNTCFYVKMPTNYVIKSKMATPSQIMKIITKANNRLEQITNIIQSKHEHFDKESKIYALLMQAEQKQKGFQESYPEFDTKFSCSDDCNGCKLCEKQCPVNNIVFHNKPVWSRHCTACLKCINICPTHAIQYNENATKGRLRYFNPNVKTIEFK